MSEEKRKYFREKTYILVCRKKSASISEKKRTYFSENRYAFLPMDNYIMENG